MTKRQGEIQKNNMSSNRRGPKARSKRIWERGKEKESKRKNMAVVESAYIRD